jgi:hypothetical protein
MYVEVLTAVTVFWDVTLCSPIEVRRRFGSKIHLACSQNLNTETGCSYEESYTALPASTLKYVAPV